MTALHLKLLRLSVRGVLMPAAKPEPPPQGQTAEREVRQGSGMGAEHQQQDLLGALEALGGSAGNGRLRELLGWDETSYDAVKAQLLASGTLVPGRGRGGSVSLASGDRAAQPAPPSPAPSSKTMPS